MVDDDPATTRVIDFEHPVTALGIIICIDNDPVAVAGSLLITGEYEAGRGVDTTVGARLDVVVARF